MNTQQTNPEYNPTELIAEYIIALLSKDQNKAGEVTGKMVDFCMDQYLIPADVLNKINN